MRGVGSYIVAFLLVATLTVIALDGVLSVIDGSGALGSRAEAPDAGSQFEPVSTADEIVASNSNGSGAVSVTVTVLPAARAVSVPVFRFFSPRSGTHFYTPSPAERDMVIATWPGIWKYEGVAYTVDPARNSQPLYRFYNRRNGSHFYTASAVERDSVFARLMNIYQYDGETFAVTPGAESGKAPVYRFYNVRNGSHFYTATAEERDIVMARWSSIYKYEGVAFWLGQ